MMEENEKSTASALVAFFAGAAAGAGLALLLAPRSGQEVRTQIKGMANDAMGKTKDYARTMQERARTMMERGKQKMEEHAPGMASAMEGHGTEERTPLS